MRDSSVTGKDRAEHIIRAIEKIDKFTENCSKELYLSNQILINATLFEFAVMGEAVIYIDNAILYKYAYPCHKVRGFRNFIVHEYHAIDFKLVWEAIKK